MTDELKVSNKRKFDEMVDHKVFEHHTLCLEYATYHVLRRLLQDTNLKLAWCTGGRLADFCAILDDNINECIGIQLKSTLNTSGRFIFHHGTSQYKGMLVICMEIHTTLYEKITKWDYTDDDMKQYIRFISIIPACNLDQSNKSTELVEHGVENFKTSLNDIYNTLKNYFNDGSVLKQSYAQWDCLGLSRSIHTEYTNTQTFAFNIRRHDIQIIPLFQVLQTDVYLKINDYYTGIQFKSSRSGTVHLYTVRKNIYRYYNKESFQILCIHHQTNEYLALFIPIQILIQDGLIENKNIKQPVIKYINYLQYEMNISKENFKDKLQKMIIDYNLQVSRDMVVKYRLPGYKYRKHRDFLTQSYSFVTANTHQQLLDDYYESASECHTNIIVENHNNNSYSIRKGFPKTCPHCKDKMQSKHVADHIRRIHARRIHLYKSFRVSDTNLPRYECLTCNKKFLTINTVKNHKKNINQCKDALYKEL